MSVAAGVMFHAIGASSASLCYTPQKKVTKWSWQTFWLFQAFICWLLLPVVVAWLTTPQFFTVLHEAPTMPMIYSFLLGAAYGIGGTAFGIAIRYVGFSLTYAISIGLSCVLGTLIPPMVAGTLGELLCKPGSQYVISGIAIGLVGIALCGLAGRFKEKDIAALTGAKDSTFSLAKGLPLCLLSGVLSAVYGFALVQGQPIADVAAKYGAGNFQGNVIYIFSNSGAFLTTAIYCIYLHVKNGTLREYTTLPFEAKGKLPLYFAMATLTGCFWYGQFFFYGLGHTRMENLTYISWAVHMIMLVLFSSLVGVVLKEWLITRPKTKWTLGLAMVVLIGAVLVLSYGNKLGG